MATLFTPDAAPEHYPAVQTVANPVLNGGLRISGNLTVAGSPARRLVRLHERVTGRVVANARSRLPDGYFEFLALPNTSTYYVVGLDDEAVTYNAEIADWLTPL